MTDEPYIRIPLRRRDGTIRAYAIIDREDAALAEHRWCLGGNGYVVRNLPRGSTGGRQERLHRVILGLAPDDSREPDHINRDPLDNRRTNLRAGLHALNLQNVPGRAGTSAHRGVYWHKRAGKWSARVKIAGKHHYLGLFVDELDAARAAIAFRAEHMPYANEERC